MSHYSNTETAWNRILNQYGILLACLSFVIIGLVQTPEVLSGDIRWGENMSTYIPERVEQARIIASGQFPLFTDKTFGGSPVLGHGHTGALYLPNLLYIFFDPTIYNWLTFFHTIIGGIGMLFYMRTFRLHPFASYCGAVFFLSISFIYFHVDHIAMRETALLAPWVLLAAHHLMKKVTPARIALLGLAIGFQFSSGYPQVVFFTLILTGMEILRHFRPDKKWILKILTTGVSIGFGLLTMTVLIIATMATIEESFRSEMTIAQWQQASFPPYSSILYAVPLAFGDTSREWQGETFPHEIVNVLHPAAFILSILAVLFSFGFRFQATQATMLKSRRMIIWGYGVLAFIVYLFSFGEHLPGHDLLFNVPVLNSFRVPSRALFLTNFCLCILASHGIHHLMKTRISGALLSWKMFQIYILIIIAGILAFLGFSEGSNIDRPDLLNFLSDRLLRSWPVRLNYISVIIVILGFAFISIKRWIVPLSVFLGVTLFSGHMVNQYLEIPHDYSAAIGTAPNPVYDQFSPDELGRVYPYLHDGDVLRPELLVHNSTMLLGYRSLGGFSPLYHDNVRDMLSIGQNGTVWQRNIYTENADPLLHLGVHHLIFLEQNMDEKDRLLILDNPHNQFEQVFHEPSIDLYIMKLNRARPRAEILPAIRIAESRDDSIGAMWNRQIFENGPYPVDISRHDLPAEILAGRPQDTEVLEENYDHRFQSFRVRSDQPGMLAIRDVYWNGWKFRVEQNGKEMYSGNVYPVLHLIRGIPVPAGESEVFLEFYPPGFGLGLIISILSFFILIAIGSLHFLHAPREFLDRILN